MVHTAHGQAPENNDRARREMCQRGGLSSIAGFIGTDLRKADKLLTTNFRFCCNSFLRCMRIQFEPHLQWIPQRMIEPKAINRSPLLIAHPTDNATGSANTLKITS